MKKLYEETHIQNIAAAIREKNGTTDTYKPSQMAEAITNIEVGGSSGSVDPIIDGSVTEVTSNVTNLCKYALAYRTSLTDISLPQATELDEYALGFCSNLVNVDVPNTQRFGIGCFKGCTSLEEIELPSLRYPSTMGFENCTKLKVCDLGWVTQLPSSCFSGCTSFNTLILRSRSLTSMGNVNALKNTPFASGGSGGTVYVPKNLIESYKKATNWSTYFTYGTCNFVAIEGSEYE